MTEAEEKDSILELLYNHKINTGVLHVHSISKQINIEMDRVKMLCALISEDGYIVYNVAPNPSGGATKIKNRGKSFFEQGGYIKQSQESSEQKDLQLQKLRLDVKNATRIYHTYWWTFGIAIVGLVISIVLLILKITEPKAPIH